MVTIVRQRPGPTTVPGEVSLGGGPVQRAELVAVGVAQVGQVELARRALAPARGSSQVVPPWATPAAWKASACSGDCILKPIVPPLACVAGCPLMGMVMPKVPVGLR